VSSVADRLRRARGAEPVPSTPAPLPICSRPPAAMIEPTSPPVLEPRPKRGCVRRFWLPALVLFVAYLGWKAITWPDVAALAKDNPKSTAFIDSYRDRWFFPDREVEWKWVPYSRISRNLRRAVL